MNPYACKIALTCLFHINICFFFCSYNQYGGSLNTSSNQVNIPIVVDSFNGAVLRVGVEKRPGMEKENLLKQDEDGQEESNNEEGGGFMGSMFGR